MPAVKLSPILNEQTLTSTGAPASGYKVYTYAAGSSTPLATYADSAGTSAQTNPIILNSSGYPTNGPIWLQAGLSYKLVLTDANGSVIRTIDSVTGVNDSSSSTSQWLSAGVVPTYVSASSFTVPGDQTTEFHVGRRLQFTVTAGTVYGIITSSAYSASTTVGVQMDSGMSLDSGLSVVNLSILRADRLALPSFLSAAYGTRGLRGNVNSGTPLTKFDLSADAVTLRNAVGALMTVFNIGTITCDLGLTGPAANGRDQSAAFSANSWVNLFFIWNGSTTALIASTAAATTGPALPTGYTHWCYATSIRWNGSSNIVPVYARGARVWYDVAEGGVNRALTSGVATAMTAVSLASLVPTNVLFAHLTIEVNATTTVLGPYYASVRPTGASNTGQRVAVAPALVSGQLTTGRTSYSVVPGTSQQIDYLISAAPTSSGGVTIDVNGYTIPNGDSQ